MKGSSILVRELMVTTVFKESKAFYKTNVYKLTSSNYLYSSAHTVLFCVEMNLDPFQGN